MEGSQKKLKKVFDEEVQVDPVKMTVRSKSK